MAREDLIAVRISDDERALIRAAATKADVSQATIVRRGAISAARSVLTAVELTEEAERCLNY